MDVPQRFMQDSANFHPTRKQLCSKRRRWGARSCRAVFVDPCTMPSSTRLSDPNRRSEVHCPRLGLLRDGDLSRTFGIDVQAHRAFLLRRLEQGLAIERREGLEHSKADPRRARSANRRCSLRWYASFDGIHLRDQTACPTRPTTRRSVFASCEVRQ